jgi:hypothetical protein
MGTVTSEWSNAERREAGLLGLLPLACAAVLVGVLFAGEPSIWPLAFIVSAACAYVSLVVGVVPLLLLFKRLGWRGWYHFAAAGYAGVQIVWLVPAAVFGIFQSRLLSRAESGLAQAVAFLSIPGIIAAVAAVTFWFLCVRKGVGVHDT